MKISPSSIAILAIVLSSAVHIEQSKACLTFCLTNENEVVYGRNFDWSVGTGAIFVNKRGIQKCAFVLPPNKPLTWVSTYGSVTFNQFSKEVPVGGMNEEGLVIESLVAPAKHPSSDERPAINELQWIQFQLDTCRTVGDVIQTARTVRISRYTISLHYFVSDKSGQSAVIEFHDGQMVASVGTNLPIHVLANRSYESEMTSFDEQWTDQGKTRSGSRFARAAGLIDDYDDRTPVVDYAFMVLDKVSQGDFTKWQVVYDITGRRIYFKTLASQSLKMVDLALFDFSNVTPALILNINKLLEGPVNDHFKSYSARKNGDLIKTALRGFKKAGILQQIRSEHIAHIQKIVEECKPAP